MKVLLDPQIFYKQKFGGISRLFVEVWKRASAEKGLQIECPLVYSENYHLNESGLEPRNIFRALHYLPRKGTGRIKDKLNEVSVRKTVKRLEDRDLDVFLSTYYDTYFLDHLNGKPYVLTVYDMIHEIFPEHFKLDAKTIPQKKILIEKADRIVAISQQTKDDILKFYPQIPSGKIDVVYLSQSVEDRPVSNHVDLPANYILFVGNRGAYKNFELFAETMVSFLLKDPSLYIVCAGGGGLSGKELSLLAQLGITGNVVQKNYKDSELGSFYKHAKAFVFPSAYEGFGIPTLEAMKCGCPVVLADSSCLPEIGGDAALYFKTDNKDSLAGAIDKVLHDELLRSELINKGYQQVKRFSWEKTAEGYFDVIKKIVN